MTKPIKTRPYLDRARCQVAPRRVDGRQPVEVDLHPVAPLDVIRTALLVQLQVAERVGGVDGILVLIVREGVGNVRVGDGHQRGVARPVVAASDDNPLHTVRVARPRPHPHLRVAQRTRRQIKLNQQRL
eukprot:917194-Pyramimonas_sp.AAC.1